VRDEPGASKRRSRGSSGTSTPVARGCGREDARGLVLRASRPRSRGQGHLWLRVASTGAFELDGHRHASECWQLRARDPSVVPSRSWRPPVLSSKLPELEDAFRSGELSPPGQRGGRCGHLRSASTTELLDARVGRLRDIGRRCAEIKAASASKEDEAARTRRVHAARRLRTWTESDGTFAWMAASVKTRVRGCSQALRPKQARS